MLKKVKLGLPARLGLIIAFALLAGHWIPEEFKSWAYAISVTLKDALILVMPFIIFAYIFACLVSFREGTILFLTSLIGSVCLSTFMATMLAFSACYYVIHLLGDIPTHTAMGHVLDPAWTIHIPTLMTNDVALAVGISLALLMSYLSPTRGMYWGERMKNGANWILNSLFIPTLPLFVMGFVLKIEHEGRLVHALSTYAPVVALFVIVEALYLAFLFAVATNFKFKEWKQALINTMPAALTAFSTMSSLATMPLTLKASQANTKNDPMVDAIVPATVNIHMMGDSIGIPIMALAILTSYGMGLPSISAYLVFAFYSILNKFAVAGVPGGGILIMMPVLQQYLGFNDEMLSLIMMLYILFDSPNTVVNVLGNNVFAILFSRAWGVLSGRKRELATEKI